MKTIPSNSIPLICRMLWYSVGIGTESRLYGSLPAKTLSRYYFILFGSVKTSASGLNCFVKTNLYKSYHRFLDSFKSISFLLSSGVISNSFSEFLALIIHSSFGISSNIFTLGIWVSNTLMNSSFGETNAWGPYFYLN